MPTDEHEHRLGDVLGKDLPAEQRAPGVVLAELLGGDAVGLGALAQPFALEDPRPLDDAVGVDAVDADAVDPELGGEQADLVGLVGLGRAVGDVLRSGEDGVLRHDVDDVAADVLLDHLAGGSPADEERAAGEHGVQPVPVVDGGVDQRRRRWRTRRC